MVKILVIGHARHGKDTVCEILKDKYGYSFMSSSEYCAENIIFPHLAPLYGYTTYTDCFTDRVNHRSEWFNIIREYNGSDPARLGKEIWSKYDIYCGLRNVEEMKTLRADSVYDLSIWVDAGNRVPKEDCSSITIDATMADYILDNSGSLEDLDKSISEIFDSNI